ncbi:MFS transporter [candidate division WOR-3 bacterium]|nr:MFS transporter [candidate division WOR-3 bacterium]
MRISVWEGSFAMVHIQLTAGVFLSGFALFLNADHFQISLLSAIPALLTPLGFISAYFISTFGKRKALVLSTVTVGRSIFFIPAFILLLGGKMNITSLLIIIFVFNAMIVLTSNAWTSWMSDLVPRERWGRYFGVRNTLVGVVSMAVSYGGAWLLDWFKDQGRQAQGFGWIFLAASIASTAALILLAVQPHPTRVPQPYKLHENITVPLKDRSYRRLLIFLAFWFVTSGIASPFYGVHMLGYLGMPYSQAVLYGLIAGVISLGFQLIWGRVIDRMHAKPVLTISYFGVASLPFLWLFARPGFLLPIWIDAVMTGVFWTGVNAALFNIVIGSASDERFKESYLALFTAVTGLGGFVSASLGGVAAQVLENFQITFMGQTFINYHALFLSAAVFRFASLPLLARARFHEARSVRFTLAAMGSYTLSRLTPAKGIKLRSFLLAAGRKKKAKDASYDG